MTLNPGETSLVIAGSWNPAILNPAWVLEHGLNRPGTNEPVQVALPAGAGGMIDYPRFTLPEFAYVVRHDALAISPAANGADAITRIEDAAAALLTKLPHTPVTGVGHNFEFRDHAPEIERLEVFTRASQELADEAPDGWASVGTMIASSFRCANGSTIANIQRQFDGANIIIKFNFHHPLSSVQQALQVLRGEAGHARMNQNFQIAHDLLDRIYGFAQ